MALLGRVESTPLLEPAVRDRMFELLAAHFLRVSRESFERDLAEKPWTILIEHAESRELAGFSTLLAMEGTALGGPFRAIYSGDTIIDRRHWGDTELARVWLRFLIDFAARAPDVPAYWFLASMGHRTYRVLPLFFRDYHPRHDSEFPPLEKSVLDTLASVRFGKSYDAARGIIRFEPARECLRPEIAELTEAQRANPAAQFFAARNPGHGRGDELACLARVSPGNLTSVARKLLQRSGNDRRVPASATALQQS